jgi:hypothetical protein
MIKENTQQPQKKIFKSLDQILKVDLQYNK